MAPMQRRHHYEQALEAYLRQRRIPYLAVHEARKALLPEAQPQRAADASGSLKNFDLVVYGHGSSLLVEVKGRRIAPRTRESASKPPRLECWTTQDDIDSLSRWECLFGPGFEAVLVFVYWCDQLPRDALFEELFEHADRWYALRTIRVSDYKSAMRVRSPRWRTVDLAAATFDRMSGPLAPATPNRLPEGLHVGWHPLAEGRDDPLPPLPAMDALLGGG